VLVSHRDRSAIELDLGRVVIVRGTRVVQSSPAVRSMVFTARFVSGGGPVGSPSAIPATAALIIETASQTYHASAGASRSMLLVAAYSYLNPSPNRNEAGSKSATRRARDRTDQSKTPMTATVRT